MRMHPSLSDLNVFQMCALVELAQEAEELSRFTATPEWSAWREKFREAVDSEPEVFFRVEVRLARIDVWIESGRSRSSLDLARAAAEDLRVNHCHADSAIRIMQGDKMIQLILPGDPPVAELAK